MDSQTVSGVIQYAIRCSNSRPRSKHYFSPLKDHFRPEVDFLRRCFETEVNPTENEPCAVVRQRNSKMPKCGKKITLTVTEFLSKWVQKGLQLGDSRTQKYASIERTEACPFKPWAASPIYTLRVRLPTSAGLPASAWRPPSAGCRPPRGGPPLRAAGLREAADTNRVLHLRSSC